MKTQRGELIGFNNCLGYRYDSKTNEMTIVEEEADIVRMIFNWYLEGYGAGIISQKLTNMKIKTFRGNNKWHDTVIYGILHNEKYVGDAMIGKTFTLDPISHKRMKNFGEADKFYIKDHHKPIISREDFDKVQELIESRKGARAYGRLVSAGKKGVFSSRIRCGYCGYTYGRNCPARVSWMRLPILSNSRTPYSFSSFCMCLLYISSIDNPWYPISNFLNFPVAWKKCSALSFKMPRFISLAWRFTS